MRKVYPVLILAFICLQTGCGIVDNPIDSLTASDAEALRQGIGLLRTYQPDGTLAASANAFIISSDGMAVTTFSSLGDTKTHRLDADHAIITLDNGTGTAWEYPVRYVMNFTRDFDAAIVKIDARGLAEFHFGDSSLLTAQQIFKLAGTPRGYPTVFNQAAEGFINALPTSGDAAFQVSVPQTAKANAGAPLLDKYNRVLGMLAGRTEDAIEDAYEIFEVIPSLDIKNLVDENRNVEMSVSDLPKENGVQAQTPLYLDLTTIGPNLIEVSAEGGNDGKFIFGLSDNNDVGWVTNWASADWESDGAAHKVFLNLHPSTVYYIFVYRQATDRYAMSALANILEAPTPETPPAASGILPSSLFTQRNPVITYLAETRENFYRVKAVGGDQGDYFFGASIVQDAHGIADWRPQDVTDGASGEKTYRDLKPAFLYYIYVFRRDGESRSDFSRALILRPAA
ncbi:MAG: serine protease [Clostridiales bacterium]|nr:serine protease [Clostridiales bacterium]